MSEENLNNEACDQEQVVNEPSLFDEVENVNVESQDSTEAVQEQRNQIDISKLVFKLEDNLYRVLMVKQLEVKGEKVEVCLLHDIINETLDITDADTLINKYVPVSPTEVVDAFAKHRKSNISEDTNKSVN